MLNTNRILEYTVIYEYSDRMLFSVFLPLLIGALGVLQNTVNKKFADQIGLPIALVINNIVLLLLSLVFWLFLSRFPQVPEIFRSKSSLDSMHWSYFLPGLFGFIIISTAPWAIQRVGAAKVFIGIIVAQIAVSLLWDYFAESISVSPTRLAGAALALAGALLAAR